MKRLHQVNRSPAHDLIRDWAIDPRRTSPAFSAPRPRTALDLRITYVASSASTPAHEILSVKP